MNPVKKLFIAVSGLFTSLSLPLVAFATGESVIDPCKDAGNSIAGVLCNLGGANIGQTIRNVVIFFIIIAVIVALMYLLYGGIKWITSKGEKTGVEAARNHIMAALLGLVVVFLAVFLLSIVLSAFGINFNQLVIPSIGGSSPSAP
jgi:hypothetical protein